MTTKWVADEEDSVEPGDGNQNFVSGAAQFGNVRQSRSGRWRWEIIQLPGKSSWREDLRGYAETEFSAKQTVEILFSEWLRIAELEPIELADAETDTKQMVFRAPVYAYKFLMQFADDDGNINRDAISKIARKLAGQ
jgi:hypothetical protein